MKVTHIFGYWSVSLLQACGIQQVFCKSDSSFKDLFKLGITFKTFWNILYCNYMIKALSMLISFSCLGTSLEIFSLSYGFRILIIK